MKIKTRLKELRIKNNLTQKDISKETGIRQGTLSDIENNKSVPSLETTVKLAELFNMNIDEFIMYEKIHSEYSSKQKKLFDDAKKKKNNDSI